MRILVAMANHGVKNRRYADTVIDAYREMTHDVDIVVLSDQPKDFGPDVEVRVGAPSKDPRSLPFAHRQLFADRVDDYDLFIYTEDDTPITQRNIDAFVEVNALLPENDVPGFQRYEEGPSGERNYSSIHSTYRWLPGTTTTLAGEVFAEHTNLHSACYILDQRQLRTAIASGGFLVPPHRGPFWSLMVTAISDVYSECGLRRRICVSRIDDFLLHHLPNLYLDKLGVDEDEYRTQIDAVLRIGQGELSAEELLAPEAALDTHLWNVPQHPVPAAELLDLVPPGVRRPLSVGATSGTVEALAFPSAGEITVVPQDEITGAVTRRRGLRTLPPRLEELRDAAPPEGFDAILVHHTLHHFPDPDGVLGLLREVAAPGCQLLVAMPNAPYHALRRLSRRPFAGRVPGRGFEQDRVHRPDARFLQQVGLRADVAWRLAPPRPATPSPAGKRLPRPLARVLTEDLYAVGRYRNSR